MNKTTYVKGYNLFLSLTYHSLLESKVSKQITNIKKKIKVILYIFRELFKLNKTVFFQNKKDCLFIIY